MAVITRIEANKRNKRRYSIYIDHRYFTSLDEEVLARNHLQEGMVVDEESMGPILYQDELRCAYNKSISYLGYRSRSRKEVADYLERKGFSTEVIEKTLEKLESYRFVDDEDFARIWVRNRKDGKLMGKRIISQELIHKGVDREIIEDALKEITEEDELRKAIQLVQRTLPKYSKLAKKEQAYKTGQVLARKGFGWEVIRKALRAVWDQAEDLEDLDS
ncbi:MAG: RecX family transcriptional regulator [Clostridia bacterium]